MDEKKFHYKIDNDSQFNKSKRLLITLSVLVLAITCSGAAVKEANTFIFKIEFAHSAGLLALLGLANTYGLLRYINFSGQYFTELRNFWVHRFLKDPNVKFFDYDSEQYYGILSPILNNWHDLHYADYKSEEMLHPDYGYKSGLIPLLGRRVEFYSTDTIHGLEIFYSEKISTLGTKAYLKLLGYELVYRIRSFIFHREPMDIYPPIFLYFIATLSILFKDKIGGLLSTIM